MFKACCMGCPFLSLPRFPWDLLMLSVKHPNQMLIIESFNTPTQTDFMLQLVLEIFYIEISFVGAWLIVTYQNSVATIWCGLVSFYPWSHSVIHTQIQRKILK